MVAGGQNAVEPFALTDNSKVAGRGRENVRPTDGRVPRVWAEGLKLSSRLHGEDEVDDAVAGRWGRRPDLCLCG